MKFSISTISAMLALVGTIAAGVFAVEVRYAKADDMNIKIVKLEKRIKVNELTDTKNKVLKRKYFLLEQLQQLPNSSAVKRELEGTNIDLQHIENQIQGLKVNGEKTD